MNIIDIELNNQAREKYICIYPQLVKLVNCDDYYGEIDESKFIMTGYPSDITLKDIADDVKSYDYDRHPFDV